MGISVGLSPKQAGSIRRVDHRDALRRLIETGRPSVETRRETRDSTVSPHGAAERGSRRSMRRGPVERRPSNPIGVVSGGLKAGAVTGASNPRETDLARAADSVSVESAAPD